MSRICSNKIKMSKIPMIIIPKTVELQFIIWNLEKMTMQINFSVYFLASYQHEIHL